MATLNGRPKMNSLLGGKVRMSPISRRDFVKQSLTMGAIACMPGMALNGLVGCSSSVPGLALPKMNLSWQGLQVKRPWAPDFDSEGKLWFGREHLYRTDPQTMKTEVIDCSSLEGLPLSAVLCQGDFVYILGQKTPWLHAWNKASREFVKFELPDTESNIWFGVRVPDDPKLYMYVRNRSHLAIWDSELNRGHTIPYPNGMDLWSGFYSPIDQAIYSFTLDAKPARLVRFDLKSQTYDRIIPAPDPELEITGINPVGHILYCADRFTGRIFPYDLDRGEWGEPQQAPGLGAKYAFVGMGCTYGDMALYSLSTYKGNMKYDFNTNKYLSTGDENIGIDGKPHHFLNEYLIYHPGSGTFDFLKANAGSGRYPLICYSIVYDDQLFITGSDLWNTNKGYVDMAQAGEMCIFHSEK